MSENESGSISFSGDQKARIEARAKRINLRQQAMDEDSGKKKKGEAEIKDLSIGSQQIANSLAILDSIKSKTIDDVTSVRVEADRREYVRRVEEDEKRQDRLRRVQEEAYHSGKNNAAVDMKWAELMEKNMPQQLMEEIKAQEKACYEIIRNKDELVLSFQAELKSKDEAFVKSLKSQAEDIDKLLKKMSDQYSSLEKHYEVELEATEQAFLQERDALLKSNKAELDNLFQKRIDMELSFKEAKQKREEEYIIEIEKIRVEDAEKFNKLKIKLETDIQTLEQQLEEMRATYQLNTEKLEYNYRVLTEKNAERGNAIQSQRRKEARLTETLTSLIQKYTAMDNSFKSQNSELTDEYRRITKQYKDLQQKFHHFELSDNKQYNDVWKMHEEEVSELVAKVLKADQIIHEQQLGLIWVPPEEDPLRPLKGTKTGRYESSDMAKADGAAGGEGALASAGGDEGSIPIDEVQHEKIQATQRVKNTKVRYMLEMLCGEAGFLIDPATRKTLDTMDTEEAAVLQADSILKALNIDTEDQVNTLLDYFFDTNGEEDILTVIKNANDMKSLGLKIKHDDVIKIVKKYVEERDSLAAKDSATKTTAAAEATAEQRERTRREEELFWKKMSSVISDKNTRVWGALEKELIKYNELLKSRSDLISNVNSLQNQNKDLKILLSQYLSAPVNEELCIPPSQVINVVRRS